MHTRSFSLKEITLSTKELLLLYVIWKLSSCTTATELILESEHFSQKIYDRLLAYGLVRQLKITETGKGLIGLLPTIIHTGRCNNCGNEKPLIAEEAIKAMYSNPEEKCNICGNKFFEEKKTAPSL